MRDALWRLARSKTEAGAPRRERSQGSSERCACASRSVRKLRSGSNAARASPPVRTAERGRERAPRGRSDERHRRRRQCPGHRTTERALHSAARQPAEVVGDGERRRRYVVCFNPREAERQRKHRAQALTELGAELSSLRASSRIEHSKRVCELRASGRYGRYIRFTQPGGSSTRRNRSEERLRAAVRTVSVTGMTHSLPCPHTPLWSRLRRPAGGNRASPPDTGFGATATACRK